MTRAADVPKESEISKQLAGAYFYDTFETFLDTDKSALDIYLDAMARTPSWINFLMSMRNKVVALFGIKDLGLLSNVNADGVRRYQIGDRVGIFSVRAMSEREVILEDADKHLDAKLSIYKYSGSARGTVAVTTVVHVHNLLGRVYMFFVVPFHKLIVPTVMRRFVP